MLICCIVGRQRIAIPEVIHIPSASDSSSKPIGIMVQRRYSSSEESDHNENTEDYVQGK